MLLPFSPRKRAKSHRFPHSRGKGTPASLAPADTTPPRLRASAGNPSPIRHQSPCPVESCISIPLRSALGREAPSAFTLIELLVVIAVIGILASIVLAAMGGANRKASIDRTRAEIAAIANALEAYRSQNGAYPPPANGNTVPFTQIQGYLQAEKIALAGNTLVDPFGQNYIYRLPPGTRNRVTFDLFSYGGAQQDETNKHVGNW